MATLTLEPVDRGARCRLTEEQWAVAAALTDLAQLPVWARPLTALTDAEPTGAGPTDATADEAKAVQPVELDDALSEAIALRGTAILEIEVTAVAGDRGVLGVLWTDGTVGSALVRGVDVRRDGGTTASRPRPGVEVSAFGFPRLLDEVLRLVPEAPVTVEAGEADVPLEISVALARALREGNGPVVEALTADLELAEPPAIVDAVARTLDGSLVVTARSAGRADVSAGSWLRCDAGWVELARLPGDVVRHSPRTRADVGRTVLFDITGRVSTALSSARPAADDGDVATDDPEDQR